MTDLLFWTLIQLKHFLADWVWQTNWMVNGKRRVEGWITPLLAHAGLHGVLTYVVVLAVIRNSEIAFITAIFDSACHFIIDRIKSNPTWSFLWDDPSKKSYWIVMGLDQLLHQMTYVIIWEIFIRRF